MKNYDKLEDAQLVTLVSEINLKRNHNTVDKDSLLLKLTMEEFDERLKFKTIPECIEIVEDNVLRTIANRFVALLKIID